MDWFYPVLGGVLGRGQAKARLAARWDTFVKEGMGCRCVSDEPWVTVAESCELTMALLGAGDHARAARLFSWLHQWRDDDGAYWTGYQLVENIMWPEEEPHLDRRCDPARGGCADRAHRPRAACSPRCRSTIRRRRPSVSSRGSSSNSPDARASE